MQRLAPRMGIVSCKQIESVGLNTHRFAIADLEALGIDTSLAITGGAECSDAKPPDLKGLTFSARVGVSGGPKAAVFAASVSGDATCIRSVAVVIDKNSLTGGTGSHRVELGGTGESWANGSSCLALAIPQNAHNGTYVVAGVEVTDSAGNQHVYSPAQLTAVGIGTSLIVTGASSDHSAPEFGLSGFPRAQGGRSCGMNRQGAPVFTMERSPLDTSRRS